MSKREFIYEIGQEIETDKGTGIILEQIYKIRKNGTRLRAYKIQCVNCGKIYERTQSKLRECDRGFKCPFCSNRSKSYGELFFYKILLDKKIKFINEYKPEWNKDKRYDFYFEISNEKYIVEIHGRQHYIDTTWTTLEKEQKMTNINITLQ